MSEPDTWFTFSNGDIRIGETSSGIICGCMPTIPQFFRHFLPKITTKLSLGNRSGSENLSASSEQANHGRASKAAHIRSRLGDSDVYVELDERSHQSETFDSSERGPHVWPDETSASDEEKGLTPIAEDGNSSSTHLQGCQSRMKG